MSKNETVQLIGRDDVLKRRKRRFAIYPIPGLGNLRVRSLTEKERSDFEVANGDDLPTARRRLICLCAVDNAGNPIFEPSDIIALEECDGADTGAIYDVCRKHCGFSNNEVEALRGNFDDGSNSDSP